MSLKKILDDWAEKLSTKAAETDTSLQESTDAFKAVTAFYAATQKRGRKPGEDDEPPEAGGFSFDHGNELVNGDHGQRKALHSRRNS